MLVSLCVESSTLADKDHSDLATVGKILVTLSIVNIRHACLRLSPSRLTGANINTKADQASQAVYLLTLYNQLLHLTHPHSLAWVFYILINLTLLTVTCMCAML